MHAEALNWLTQHAQGLGRIVLLVDVGGRNINGSVRPLFDAERIIGVDLYPGPEVDVVCDVRGWEPDALADVVVCAEVLEHAPDAAGVVRACRRLLKPGGRLLLTAAAPPRAPHSGHDGLDVREGEYYGNVEPLALAKWLSCFSRHEITYDRHHGDVYAEAIA
jgi:SAM-dependent methyltransferase